MKLSADTSNQTMHRYVLSALIALELLMSFSFLGYFHVEPISITIAYIPVLIAGALLSPASSALVGLFFGLASMWKASANYVMPADQLFSPLFSGEPVGSLVLSVGSRVLFMDEGRIAEQGTPAQLKASGGVYARMLALQGGGE